MMLPLMPVLCWCCEERVLKGRSVKSCVLASVKLTFLFSLAIELAQLFLRVGEFQFSDLFCNTLGGAAGGLMWLAWVSVRGRVRDR